MLSQTLFTLMTFTALPLSHGPYLQPIFPLLRIQKSMERHVRAHDTNLALRLIHRKDGILEISITNQDEGNIKAFAPNLRSNVTLHYFDEDGKELNLKPLYILDGYFIKYHKVPQLSKGDKLVGFTSLQSHWRQYQNFGSVKYITAVYQVLSETISDNLRGSDVFLDIPLLSNICRLE